ncbi:MAG TPA: hypothetical protein VF894_13540 [Anaeromyxobacter sp.]
MHTMLRAAFGAALLASAGCSLTIDPGSVAPPTEKRAPPPRGACITTASGHAVCGDAIGPGARTKAPASGHAVRGRVDADGAQAVASSQHRIAQGAVTP